MKTVTDSVRERVEEVRVLARELLLEHSNMHDLNRPDSSVFIVGASHGWEDLDEDGRRLQSRLLKELDTLSPLVSALLRDAPEEARRKLDESQENVRAMVDQSHLAWVKTPAAAFELVGRSLDTQLELIGHLYDPAEGAPVFVPDTNALLWNLELEAWNFEGAREFVLLLLPIVLGEIDRLKIEHRNPDVRAKADSLISRLKGYRTRGRLLDGVRLRRDTSTLRTLATEPNMEETLPWLDVANADDRLLASVIDVMRTYPRSAVVLVTRDINLQNKADYAGIPYCEPPDPAA